MAYKTWIKVFLFALFILSFNKDLSAQNSYNYNEESLSLIISDIQKKSGWQFLYRESLVTGTKITLNSNQDEFLRDLQNQLSLQNLELRVDSTRQQILILESKVNAAGRSSSVNISGQIVDAVTGERLPLATVSWKENQRLRGISTGNAANFSININNGGRNPVELTASYVGYEPATVLIPAGSNSINGLTVRLKPLSVTANEIIVSGTSYYSSTDSSYSGLIETGRFSPFGEANAVRALQVLPSVGISTALNDGLNVRGSSPDGLLLLLDGITIFNQSHLFGLLDSFNPDAIQSSGFFYDVSPAQIQSPTGGTLSLITRTGSLNQVKGKAGISNSSYKATIEGPIVKGKSSWLISGRGSLLNTIDWFNNSELIRWGLDIDRPGNIQGNNIVQLEDRLVTPLDSEAEFFDLHGKLYFEGKTGNRWIASLYYGGDFSSQLTSRLVRSFEPGENFIEDEFETENDWGNFSASLKRQGQLSDRVYSHTLIGASLYESDFIKEDFVYTRLAGSSGSRTINVFTFPFENVSTMNQVKAEQSFDIIFNRFSLSAGAAYFYYRGDYRENSFERPTFLVQSESSQVDGFFQADIKNMSFADVSLGSRFHFYSAGNFTRVSPRVKVRLFPDSNVSLGLGFSRNHQFLHRIGLDNAVTSDVWILSTETQPPASVNHYSAGIYISAIPRTFFQAEGFIKNSENLRLHEINVQTLSNTFSDTPWFFENEGEGRGIEFLLRNMLGNVSLTQTYSLSSMKLRNSAILNGESFFADWDRRHRYSATAEVSIAQSLGFFASWFVASGVPENLALDNSDLREDRLGTYKRLDLSLKYSENFSFGKLDASVTLYNVLDFNNPWYRDFTLAIDESRRLPRLRSVSVDVYDLGFQPSFQLVYSF